MKNLFIVAAAVALVAAMPARANADLAQKKNCMACHATDKKLIGPAYKDVAAKYAGQKGAQKTLTATVLAGSNPYESHWKGKVSGLAMPPNAVAIKEADAKQLVKWILALEAGKKS